MTDDTAKFETLAPTLRWMPKWVRENLSPRAAWAVIMATFTTGVWVTHESSSRVQSQHANADMREAQTGQIQATKELNVAVNQLNTKVEVLLTKVDDISHRVDEQQSRWDRAEEVAAIRIPTHRQPSRSIPK